MKILSEKQEATELFINVQKEAAISEAQERLSELNERSQKLKENQGQIAALHNLTDTELIKVWSAHFILFLVWLVPVQF